MYMYIIYLVLNNNPHNVFLTFPLEGFFLRFPVRFSYVSVPSGPVRFLYVFLTFLLRVSYVFLTFPLANPVRGHKAPKVLQINTCLTIFGKGSWVCQKQDFLSLAQRTFFLRFFHVSFTFPLGLAATFFSRFFSASQENGKP